MLSTRARLLVCRSLIIRAPPPTSPLRSTSAKFRIPALYMHSGAPVAPASDPKTDSPSKMAAATKFYEFSPADKTGKPYPFDSLHGKVVLIVNTASKCGFTPQFEGLEKLWKDVSAKYPDNFVMLGFPCNQFGGQDPHSDEKIQEFCQVNYGVSFPIMKKTEVNGDQAEPLYTWMKAEKPGIMGLKRIKWNFEKFLIGADGQVKQRWGSITKPEALESAILEELKKAPSATTTAAAPAPSAEAKSEL